MRRFRRGYRSAFALPLKSNGAVFGALVLYADRSNAFDEQTRSHFADLANDLAYGVMAIRTRVERARVEAEMRRVEAYLEEGQRLTHTGSWAWNVATRENVYWSREHYRIFGLDPEKDAQSFETALPKISEDRANFVEILDTAIRERTDFEVDWRIPAPDRTLRYLHSVGHPVIDKDGEVVEFVGTLVDVTEQHLARMALERENVKRRRAEDELRGATSGRRPKNQPNRKLGLERDHGGGVVVGRAFSHFRTGSKDNDAVLHGICGAHSSR